jgi:hypothetical protein
MYKKSNRHADTLPLNPEEEHQQSRYLDLNRREFISGVGRVTGIALAAGVVGTSSLMTMRPNDAEASSELEPQLNSSKGFVDGKKRQVFSFEIKKNAALDEKKRRVIIHETNGDEDRYPSRIGNFSKTLPHDPITGEVDPDSYNALLHALNTAKFEDFENIPAGGEAKFSNPCGGFVYNMEGPDNAAIKVNPPPALASPEFAAQLAELYWMACLRDVPFSEFGSHPLALAAQNDLSKFSGYTGPSDQSFISSQDIFRTSYDGVQTGPMISQLLYQPFNYDGISIDPIIDKPTQEEFVTDFATWVNVQNGNGGPGGIPTEGTKVYPRTVRDLGKIAGSDTIISVYFRAMKILGSGPSDAANPYNNSARQSPFATFGLAHLVELIGKLARGERYAWWQKWNVHRFLRPEAAGGRVHRIKTDGADYPIHDDLIMRSSVLDHIHDKFGSYLLPQMFRNGSPSHPSFTAGHSIMAGACVTMMKAWFDENAIWPFDPVEATPDGQALVPYVDETLTVGGELNKLAHNLSFGRDMSGVHWRADNIEGNRQGEELAIRLLREEKVTFAEDFDGFTLTKFDGEIIKI